MHRTQIYLTENIYKRLLKLKKISGKSIAYIIREILTKNIEKEEKSVGNNLLDLENIVDQKINLNKNIKNFLRK